MLKIVKDTTGIIGSKGAMYQVAAEDHNVITLEGISGSFHSSRFEYVVVLPTTKVVRCVDSVSQVCVGQVYFVISEGAQQLTPGVLEPYYVLDVGMVFTKRFVVIQDPAVEVIAPKTTTPDIDFDVYCGFKKAPAREPVKYVRDPYTGLVKDK